MLVFKNECKYDDRDKEKANMTANANGTVKLRCCYKGSFKADVACGPGVQKG